MAIAAPKKKESRKRSHPSPPPKPSPAVQMKKIDAPRPRSRAAPRERGRAAPRQRGSGTPRRRSRTAPPPEKKRLLPRLPWKRVASAACCLVALVFLAHILFGGAAHPAFVGRLNVDPIPLTKENLAVWCQEAESLVRLAQKSQPGARPPSRLLADFIEWGRSNPEWFAAALRQDDIKDFLGIALSLDRARLNFRKSVEYECGLDKIAERPERMDSPEEWCRDIPEPSCTKRESKDLDVYYDASDEVESTLKNLLPRLPPLIPAWLEEPETASTNASNAPSAQPDSKQPVLKPSWRVISRSRYGPRILRHMPK